MQQFNGNVAKVIIQMAVKDGFGGGGPRRLALPAIAIAEIAEDAIDRYRVLIGETSKPWAERPDAYKKNCADGVRLIFENTGITAETVHALWVSSRAKEGWVYGPVQDLDAKTHPMMCDWDDVPDAQRRKDELFINIVRAFEAYANGE